MLSDPRADAVLQLNITTSVLASLRRQRLTSDDADELEYIDDQIVWHELRLVADEQQVRDQCEHVWVPAGLDPDDERVCARCGEPEQASARLG